MNYCPWKRGETPEIDAVLKARRHGATLHAACFTRRGYTVATTHFVKHYAHYLMSRYQAELRNSCHTMARNVAKGGYTKKFDGRNVTEVG